MNRPFHPRGFSFHSSAVTALGLILPACFNGPTGYEEEVPSREFSCNDGIDQDQDGRVDCQDPDCDFATNCIEDCDDGIDNDLDNIVDCRDPDCSVAEVCIEICDDGIDNDADRRVDCDDTECADRTPCVEDCSNRSDDDNDGTIGCEDTDCRDSEWCPEACANGVDDDFDGDLDCADDECDCFPEGDGFSCEDEADNDWDGLVDCNDPGCAEMPFCNCSGTMRGGECLTEPWSGEVDGPVSYIRAVQVPPLGSRVDCCFDYDGDGRIDNGYALLVAAMTTFGEYGRDANEIFENQLGRGDGPILLSWEPGLPDARWLYRATNDLDGDGAADQDSATRSNGGGVFQILSSSVDEFGAVDQLNRVERAGRTASGFRGVRFPMPVLFLRGLHDVPLQQAQIRGEYRETEIGAYSIDEEAEIDGEVLEFGGIELGGVVAIDDIAAIFEAEFAQCECAGFDQSEPVLLYGETADAYQLECNQEPDDCTGDPNPLCANATTLCTFLPVLPRLALDDIDTNGNGIGDALSVGLRLSAVPAGLAVPAVGP